LNPSLKYAASALLIVAAGTLVLWPFLDQPARRGVLAAGLVALPVQIAAFRLVMRVRGRTEGFMAAMIGGMAIRGITVLAVAVGLVLSGSPSLAPMLLSLVGFLFALLMLETWFFASAPDGTPKGTA
jgi:hypothetical protein